MTIDERLEKLAERHEALTQTVELLVGMQRQNEERFGQVMEAINRLTHIVEIHEQRLEDLEGE
ncbi:MAG TPA: hypothetical protein VGF59_26420 [Bryobacteraceae bacterium]|jgi:hypothetical protein